MLPICFFLNQLISCLSPLLLRQEKKERKAAIGEKESKINKFMINTNEFANYNFISVIYIIYFTSYADTTTTVGKVALWGSEGIF